MAHRPLKLAVFISGRGSNMSALIDACEQSDFPAEISVVLSNRPDAAGLNVAQDRGLVTACVDHTLFENRQAFEAALLDTLGSYDIDLICLAGFMRLLSPHFIDHFQKRIVNIHPSLLPAYKGLNTHERALENRESKGGCTVHYVVPAMDSGEIIVQKEVDILPEDTADSLAVRVLEQEHLAYPEAIRLVAARMGAS